MKVLARLRIFSSQVSVSGVYPSFVVGCGLNRVVVSRVCFELFNPYFESIAYFDPGAGSYNDLVAASMPFVWLVDPSLNPSLNRFAIRDKGKVTSWGLSNGLAQEYGLLDLGGFFEWPQGK